MTIEGAIVSLQSWIDSEDIPCWAKPSLKKIKETVEMERELYIEERKTNDVLDKIRAEIVELQKEYHEHGWAYDDAIEIIDKYKEGAE